MWSRKILWISFLLIHRFVWMEMKEKTNRYSDHWVKWINLKEAWRSVQDSVKFQSNNDQVYCSSIRYSRGSYEFVMRMKMSSRKRLSLCFTQPFCSVLFCSVLLTIFCFIFVMKQTKYLTNWKSKLLFQKKGEKKKEREVTVSIGNFADLWNENRVSS